MAMKIYPIGWLVVLMFYGPSTHFRSFRARSVNLATLFLSAHYFAGESEEG